MDLFDEVIDFEILGGFEDETKKANLIKRAEKLGLNVEDYETLKELLNAIEELESLYTQ